MADVSIMPLSNDGGMVPSARRHVIGICAACKKPAHRPLVQCVRALHHR